MTTTLDRAIEDGKRRGFRLSLSRRCKACRKGKVEVRQMESGEFRFFSATCRLRR